MSKVRVIVDSLTRVSLEDLPPGVASALKDAHVHDNPSYLKKKRMGFPTHWTPPRFKTYEVHDGWLCVPRGGYVKLRALVADYNAGVLSDDHVTDFAGAQLSLAVSDRRVDGWVLPGRIPEHRVKLRPYQQEAVDAILKRQNGIVRAPTGCGKTCVAIGALVKLGVPVLIAVWSAKLMTQWIERLRAELGLKRSEIGIVQGSKRELRMVTVAMQQTLANRENDDELHAAFGAVFADEVQRWAAPTAKAALSGFKARVKIGISADERRKDRMEALIYEQFGSIICDVDKAQLEAEGSVLPVDFRVVPTEFRADWYDTQAPLESEDGQPSSSYNRLLDAIGSDEDRNALIARYAQNEVQDGKQVLVMTWRREHVLMLTTGTDLGVLIGGDDYSAQFDEAKAALKAGSMNLAVGTIQATGTGIDIPSLSCGIVAAPLATNKQLLEQVRGRFCRPFKNKKPIVYYLADVHVFGITPVQALARSYPGLVKVLAENGEWIDPKVWIKAFRTSEHEKEKRLEAGSLSGLFQ